MGAEATGRGRKRPQNVAPAPRTELRAEAPIPGTGLGHRPAPTRAHPASWGPGPAGAAPLPSHMVCVGGSQQWPQQRRTRPEPSRTAGPLLTGGEGGRGGGKGGGAGPGARWTVRFTAPRGPGRPSWQRLPGGHPPPLVPDTSTERRSGGGASGAGPTVRNARPAAGPRSLPGGPGRHSRAALGPPSLAGSKHCTEARSTTSQVGRPRPQGPWSDSPQLPGSTCRQGLQGSAASAPRGRCSARPRWAPALGSHRPAGPQHGGGGG